MCPCGTGLASVFLATACLLPLVATSAEALAVSSESPDRPLAEFAEPNPSYFFFFPFGNVIPQTGPRVLFRGSFLRAAAFLAEAETRTRR